MYRQRLEELDDDDGDGWSQDQGDCDDLDAVRFPTNPERCDEIDNDCDGEVDEHVGTTLYADEDGDGYGNPDVATSGCSAAGVEDATDCDDARADVHPAAVELCDDVEQDCDAAVDEDAADPDAATVYLFAARPGP